MFASIYALMHVIHYNTVQPSITGNFLELYAIAGAVLGGCSLRGGEGITLGMLIGTAIMRLLPNLTMMWNIPSALEPTVIGGALLVCAILDEQLRRGVSGRDLAAPFVGCAAILLANHTIADMKIRESSNAARATGHHKKDMLVEESRFFERREYERKK